MKKSHNNSTRASALQIALSLALVLGLGYNAYSTHTNLEERIAFLEHQLAEAQRRIAELEGRASG